MPRKVPGRDAKTSPDSVTALANYLKSVPPGVRCAVAPFTQSRGACLTGIIDHQKIQLVQDTCAAEATWGQRSEQPPHCPQCARAGSLARWSGNDNVESCIRSPLVGAVVCKSF